MYDSREDRSKCSDNPDRFSQHHWKTGQYTGHHYLTSGPTKYKKFAKRAKGKANRRSDDPQTQMRGYGWGRDNYKYAAS